MHEKTHVGGKKGCFLHIHNLKTVYLHLRKLTIYISFNEFVIVVILLYLFTKNVRIKA